MKDKVGGTNNMSSYLSRIEWELLNNELKIENVQQTDYVQFNIKEINIKRDPSSYKLVAVAKGKGPIQDRGDSYKLAGSIVETFTLSGSNYYGNLSFIIDGCFIVSENKQIDLTSEDNVNVESRVHFDEIKAIYSNQGEISWLTEWYINGPRSFNYPRVTDRTYLEEHTIKRLFIDEKELKLLGEKSSKHERDCAFINSNEIKFIIHKVPKEFGPECSENIGIEYRNIWGIPDRETRTAISE